MERHPFAEWKVLNWEWDVEAPSIVEGEGQGQLHCGAVMALEVPPAADDSALRFIAGD